MAKGTPILSFGQVGTVGTRMPEPLGSGMPNFIASAWGATSDRARARAANQVLIPKPSLESIVVSAERLGCDSFQAMPPPTILET